MSPSAEIRHWQTKTMNRAAARANETAMIPSPATTHHGTPPSVSKRPANQVATTGAVPRIEEHNALRYEGLMIIEEADIAITHLSFDLVPPKPGCRIAHQAGLSPIQFLNLPVWHRNVRRGRGQIVPEVLHKLELLRGAQVEDGNSVLARRDGSFTCERNATGSGTLMLEPSRSSVKAHESWPVGRASEPGAGLKGKCPGHAVPVSFLASSESHRLPAIFLSPQPFPLPRPSGSAGEYREAHHCRRVTLWPSRLVQSIDSLSRFSQTWQPG